MMEWTDRHCRYFHRLLTRRARLYTEMVTTGALLHGAVPRHLDFDAAEQPVALQLGGSEPDELAQAARLGERWGYAEINLNCGCPSERVQRGAFGACLMAEPVLVADCVAAMRDAVAIPVTVKHRIGIDRFESYGFVRDFVGTVAARGGCELFIVHARNAWLHGVSPKENRELPPLRHEIVVALKQDFPALGFVLNGGVHDSDAIAAHLRAVDGVMVGRKAYHQPWDLAGWDARFFAATPSQLSRDDVEAAMIDYMERLVASTGEPWSHVSRHILGLRHGEPGARRWRQVWSDHRLKQEAPRTVARLARAALRATFTPSLAAAMSPEPLLPTPARTQPLALP
jgi:tRNA-dihydrouridine synthase A